MRRLLSIPKAFLGRLRRRVERLRPYPALLILVIPLAVVEPLKLTTVLIAGEGHWIASGVVLVFAYLISLFVTHWLVCRREAEIADLAVVRAQLEKVRPDSRQDMVVDRQIPWSAQSRRLRWP